MKVVASPMTGPGPATFRHQGGPLGQARWASLPHPLEPEAGSEGGPLHTWGLALAMTLTHHAPLHT